jgi:hypothetical protein
MAWYDHVPVAGSIARLSRLKDDGDFTKWFTDQTQDPSLIGSVITKPLAESQAEGVRSQNKGFQDAIAGLGTLSNDIFAQNMQGLDRAENYYLPAEERLESLYGPPGSFRK